ncbi:TPA: hypothetical protein [Aquificae Conch Spring virus]|nr:TPA: hypothetical protein [Aquificae Conch Spring virus]
MLYTKHRKIKLIDAKKTWGEFETWRDFGETWGDYLVEDPHYQFVWLRVPFKTTNVLKNVKWIGYEGLRGYLTELMSESFYRRWGWVKWTEIFGEKILANASDLIIFGVNTNIVLGTYLRIKKLFDLTAVGLQIGSVVIFENSFVWKVLSVISCQVSDKLSFECNVFESYRWELFETWGDFPNDRWAPLWSTT